ncbi:C6 zinc finger domain protein [Aspergillus sclerotioniger CBS 115572]|uniref:C6 zinc finger domain protein n=1 Tax=Aspergillus sclerotioniger CBS 115572 TaxID=1450535 RepID=A0A317X6H4_9EURO|nr:C6 zinc finger domain protein [Aspergillus sclerotioniger CBS 115572]PWY94224.1 C6 zinc finger domain protein [Aspergillus sclerotioniger CBS 115572]
MPAMTVSSGDQMPMDVEPSSGRARIAVTESKKSGATNSQSLPPPPSQPTADGEYRCGICNKTYSRRDLRDRHRRRCIKNIGQERQSKRKSCDACAQKKLRCSMTRPSCSRCLQSRRPCVYPQSSVPVQGATLEDPPEALDSSAGSLHAVPACAGLIPGGTPWPLPVYPFDPSSTCDELNEIPGSWSPDTPSHADFAIHGVNDSTMFPMQDVSMIHSPPWNDDFHEQPETFGLEDYFPGSLDTCSSHSSQMLYMPPHGTMGSSPVTMVPPTPAGLPGDSYTAARGLNLSSLSAGYFDNIWTDGMAPNDEEDDPWRLSTYSVSRTGSAFGQSFLPKTSHHTPGDISDLYQELFSLLREYPGLTLQRQFCSPFLHHQLQGYAMQSMGEPLSTTLSSISSYASYMESCDTFDLTMHTEDRLAAAEGCVVALHGVCVNQILSIFGDNFPVAGMGKLPNPAEDGQAEAPVSFLLRMIQRVYKLHEDILRTPHEDETDWKRWKFTESLRRNIFFANIIGTLAGKARRFNGAYIDPLDSAILLQLPLPAPEEMWRARSEGEWMISRAQTLRSWTRGLDGGMLPAPRTLQQLLVLEEVGSVSVTLLLPITRMILACAKLNGASYS